MSASASGIKMNQNTGQSALPVAKSISAVLHFPLFLPSSVLLKQPGSPPRLICSRSVTISSFNPVTHLVWKNPKRCFISPRSAFQSMLHRCRCPTDTLTLKWMGCGARQRRGWTALTFRCVQLHFCPLLDTSKGQNTKILACAEGGYVCYPSSHYLVSTRASL